MNGSPQPTSNRILTVTLNPALDLSSWTDRLEPTHKLRCVNPEMEPGGGGINVSRALRELGCSSEMLVWLGGHNGKQLEELLRDDGFFPSIVWHGNQTRSSLAIHERSSGLQYRFTFPGSEPGADELAALHASIRQHLNHCGYIVLSGSIPPGVSASVYADCITEARERGVRSVLDASGEALRLGLASSPWLAKLDYYEAIELPGCDQLPIEEGIASAQRLRAETGTEIIIITLKEHGAAIASESGGWRIAPPEVKVNSAIGAGDSFVAAFVDSVVRGASLRDAASAGVGAAAAAVTTPGSRLIERELAQRLSLAVRVVEELN